jgi:hypothetical protein
MAAAVALKTQAADVESRTNAVIRSRKAAHRLESRMWQGKVKAAL